MANTPPNAGIDGRFIADWNDSTVFSDLEHVAKVDDPQRMLDHWRKKPTSSETGGAEATVGRLETVDAALLSLLAQHSRAVCRITVPEGGYVNYQNEPADFRAAPWTGTGFLVAPNLLLTNHHVLNSVEVAGAATVEFDYQISDQDLVDGPPDTRPNSKLFKLVPERLFLTSTMDDFDYTFVWIEPAAAKQFGTIKMTRGSFTVRKTEPTFIIHHPGGAPKQASLDDTEVLSINSSAVLYAADTAGGTSGAPVFCRRGRLVALHHAWRPTHYAKTLFPSLVGQLNDGRHTNVVNEGIKMSAIAIDLEARVAKGDRDATAAQTVLAAFHGSDTMTGLFGSLGRHARSQDDTSGKAAPSAYERVVQVYEGRAQDLDIGAWNIEWLNRDYKLEGKLERVATVITDLNLDIWALSEVSPDAVNALVELLQSKFNQEYVAAFSEPDAGSGKQSTAMLWRPNLVEGERVDWPADIDNLLRKSSRDDTPFEAVHGKIFNRYPGLFRFRLKSTEKAFDFFMIPLHLKAKSEGSLRRKMASKALSYAIEKMVNQHGVDADWVILGDVNGTLGSGDFDPLTQTGFVPLSAADEANGGFTYLKAPYKSLIDNIFVSANMSRLVDEDDFYIVATDRKVTRFVEETSDHRPIALRLSLSDLPDAPQPQEGSDEAAFDQMLARLSGPCTQNAGTAHEQGPHHRNWQTAGRDKVAFVRDNTPAFRQVIAEVNADLAAHYGATHAPLTLEDVAVIIMVEAGITATGKVDPAYAHSNGEVGLLPLPRNIKYWTDANVPAFDQLSEIDVNIRYYLAYLGALKNKHVKTIEGRALYRDLFADLGISGCPAASAKLLAGVVHGYFWEGNYATGTLSLGHLLDGYRRGASVPDLMRPTGYVHAGKPMLEGRQRNIDAAFRLLV